MLSSAKSLKGSKMSKTELNDHVDAKRVSSTPFTRRQELTKIIALEYTKGRTVCLDALEAYIDSKVS